MFYQKKNVAFVEIPGCIPHEILGLHKKLLSLTLTFRVPNIIIEAGRWGSSVLRSILMKICEALYKHGLEY